MESFFKRRRANVKDLEKKDGRGIGVENVGETFDARHFFCPFSRSKNNIMEIQVRRCLR